MHALDNVAAWCEQRRLDLAASYNIALRSSTSLTLPGAEELPALATGAATTLFLATSLLLLNRRTRKLFLEVTESVLASLLLVVLLLVVIGFPIGVVYLLYKGVVYFFGHWLLLPAIAAFFASVHFLS